MSGEETMVGDAQAEDVEEIEEFEPVTETPTGESHDIGDPDDEFDESMDDDLDPEFAVFLTYIEAMARRAVQEVREAIETDPDADVSDDDKEVQEPEPGSAEYDIRNGIPAYEFD